MISIVARIARTGEVVGQIHPRGIEGRCMPGSTLSPPRETDLAKSLVC